MDMRFIQQCETLDSIHNFRNMVFKHYITNFKYNYWKPSNNNFINLELTRLGLKVYLGIIGNRLAYSAKTYDSIQSFRDVQRTWAVLTLAVFLIGWCAIVAAMTLPVLVNSLNT